MGPTSSDEEGKPLFCPAVRPATLIRISKYADNHVVTAGYTRRFADPAGCVRRVDLRKPPEAEAERRNPKTVGYRSGYFTDPKIAREAERRLSVIEGKGLEALADLDKRWPLEGERSLESRVDLARLVAVHMVRTPAFRGATAKAQAVSLARKMPEYQLDPSQEKELLHHLTSEEFVIDHMFSMITKNTSMIASAHWSLIEFDDRLLASSDQPVTAVPLLGDGDKAPIQPQPIRGLLNPEEFRFPIDPSRLLLCTWVNDLDAPEPIRADDDIAADLNRAVIAQADQEWFYHPARRPTSLPRSGVRVEGCSAVGRSLLPGYDAAVAVESGRRHEANNCIEKMTEDAPNENGEIKIYVGRVKLGAS